MEKKKIEVKTGVYQRAVYRKEMGNLSYLKGALIRKNKMALIRRERALNRKERGHLPELKRGTSPD